MSARADPLGWGDLAWLTAFTARTLKLYSLLMSRPFIVCVAGMLLPRLTIVVSPRGVLVISSSYLVMGVPPSYAAASPTMTVIDVGSSAMMSGAGVSPGTEEDVHTLRYSL